MSDNGEANDMHKEVRPTYDDLQQSLGDIAEQFKEWANAQLEADGEAIAALESRLQKAEQELAELKKYESVSEELHRQKTEMMHEYDDHITMLESRAKQAEEALREIAGSAVTFDDHRISYVEIQVDRDTWQQIKALSTSTPTCRCDNYQRLECPIHGVSSTPTEEK